MILIAKPCVTFMVLHNQLLGRGLYKTLPCLSATARVVTMFEVYRRNEGFQLGHAASGKKDVYFPNTNSYF